MVSDFPESGIGVEEDIVVDVVKVTKACFVAEGRKRNGHIELFSRVGGENRIRKFEVVVGFRKIGDGGGVKKCFVGRQSFQEVEGVRA